MAKQSVQIDSGPVSPKDSPGEVPKEKWHDLMLARRYFLEVKLSSDCRCLVEFVNDAKIMFRELGFASVEHMIRDGYRLEPDEIAIAVRWLELNPPSEPVSLDQAITLGKRGRPKKGEEKHGNAILKPGTHRAYTLARLDRDAREGNAERAELAEKVRAGDLSANAAAIEAGFRKKPVKRCPKCGHEW